MIQGKMNSRCEAVVPLVIHGRSEQRRSIDAVVDTGFDGDLVLPTTLIRDLGLGYRQEIAATVGDDRRVRFMTYRGLVEWHGMTRRIVVLAAESGPLLGMSLLYRCRLTLEAVEGGEVRIDPPVERGT